MDIEIITVGTELLLGDTLDTNSRFLSEELKNLGFNIYKKVTVGDNTNRLYKEIKQGLEEVDMVITTGGLGPTNDDLTKETAVRVFDQETVLHEDSYNRLVHYFEGRKEALEGNTKQACFPKDAVVLRNDHGTAPGAILEKDEKYIVVLPGPPAEMEPMFENYLKPILEEKADSIIYSESLSVARLGEWEMAKKVEKILETYRNPTVAPYAKKEGVILKITAKAADKDKAIEKIKPVKEEIKKIFGKLIYSENGDNRQTVLYKLLKEKNLKVMTAESITGGLTASKLIEVPGMSDHLKESLILYSDEAKTKYLKVKAETLEKHTAVSREVCEEMVKGILDNYDTDLAIATTGYAGPGEHAGLSFVGVGYQGEIEIQEVHFRGERNKIRNRVAGRAIEEAIFILRK
ncbi:MAG: competence/damage-inducible protein A [Gallicola sp.]|nr:competence/damage-inducible protein A [Gallicola sp.]